MGRFACPGSGILNSQSVAVSDQGRVSGYDAYQKIKDRKRHVLVDIVGNLFEAVVEAVTTNDRQEATGLKNKVEHFIAFACSS